MQEYMKANRGVPLQNLKLGEQIMIDMTEALGESLIVQAQVEALHSHQQMATQYYAAHKQQCIDWYRRTQKECQDANVDKLTAEAKTGNVTALERYDDFIFLCGLLAALHEAIYSTPMRIYRVSDICKYATTGKHARGTSSRPVHVREPGPDGGEERREEFICNIRPDGSLTCALASHTLHGGGLVLNLISVLGVQSIVMVPENQLTASLDHYKQLLTRDKQAVQQEYRNIYASCIQFTKLPNNDITADQWRQFQDECVRLVAMRNVLHNKDIPFENQAGYEAYATMMASRIIPDRQFVASVIGEKYADGSGNGQQVDSAGTSTGFVRTAKAEELYGKLCLLGDENTPTVNIQFKDIADEPDITVMLKDMLGVNLVCVTDGRTLAGMLVKARHQCKVDRQGADLLCDQLLKSCLQQDPNQLMDFVKIGDKKAYKAYQVLLEECMFHMVLKCVIDGMPLKIRIGTGDLHVPPFEQADVIVCNNSEDGCCAIYFIDNPIICRLTA